MIKKRDREKQRGREAEREKSREREKQRGRKSERENIREGEKLRGRKAERKTGRANKPDSSHRDAIDNLPSGDHEVY